MIEEFASKVETLYIVEELDPVIEEQVRSWGIPAVGKEIFTVQGEYSANMLLKAILKENPDLKKNRQKLREDRRFFVRDVRIEVFSMY